MKSKILIILFFVIIGNLSMNALTFTQEGITYEILSENERSCSVIGASSNLTNIVIPDQIEYQGQLFEVVKINSSAFSNSDATTLDIGNNVKEIGERAFYGMKSLIKINFGTNIKTIGKEAFSNCTQITNIIIPEKVTLIGESAFEECTSLYNIFIGNNVETIEDRAFFNNQASNIDLGTSVKYIGKAAFYNSWTRGPIVIPDCVIEIDDYAFFKTLNSSHYTSTLTLGNGIIKIGASAFLNHNCTEIKFGENLKIIGNSAFKGNERCTRLELPKTLIEIGDSAFRNLNRVEYLYLGENLTSIGKHAFQNCTALKELIIPNSVKIIEGGAFAGCTSLSSVDLGKKVERINGSFNKCENITIVKSRNVNPPIISNAGFSSNTTSKGTLSVPEKSYSLYKEAEYWKDFSNVEGIHMWSCDDFDEELDANASTKERLYLQQSQELDLIQYVTGEEITEWTCSNEEIVNLDEEKGTISAKTYGEAKVRGKNAEGNVMVVFDIFVCPTISIQYGNGKSYEHHVIYNSRPSLYIAAPEGYVVAGISHDGMDVTEAVKANEGYYTPASPITDNTVISVSLNSTAIPGDLNGDGKVDTSDLNWLLEQMMNF